MTVTEARLGTGQFLIGLRTCAHKAKARCGPSAHQAHKLIFTDEERKEYGFGTFEEDLKATNEDCYSKGDMGWEDVVKCAQLVKMSATPGCTWEWG